MRELPLVFSRLLLRGIGCRVRLFGKIPGMLCPFLVLSLNGKGGFHFEPASHIAQISGLLSILDDQVARLPHPWTGRSDSARGIRGPSLIP